MGVDGDKLVESLKKLLKAQQKTYRSLAQELGVSEPTVKRMFAQKNFSLDRVVQICQLLGVTLLDVARMSQASSGSPDIYLTHDQEEALCERDKLFVLFNLLRKNWRIHDILKKFDFSENELTQGLVELDRIGVIELHPQNKIKLRVSAQLQWLPDGPVRKMYEALVKDDFFRHEFKDKNDRLRYMTCEISDQTLRLILRKIDRLTQDIAEHIVADEGAQKTQTKSFAFLLGVRPWVFDITEKYARHPNT